MHLTIIALHFNMKRIQVKNDQQQMEKMKWQKLNCQFISVHFL